MAVSGTAPFLLWYTLFIAETLQTLPQSPAGIKTVKCPVQGSLAGWMYCPRERYQAQGNPLDLCKTLSKGGWTAWDGAAHPKCPSFPTWRAATCSFGAWCLISAKQSISHLPYFCFFLARSPHLVVHSSPFPFQKEKHTQILTESDHGCSEPCCALVQTPPMELHQKYWWKM